MARLNRAGWVGRYCEKSLRHPSPAQPITKTMGINKFHSQCESRRDRECGRLHVGREALTNSSICYMVSCPDSSAPCFQIPSEWRDGGSCLAQPRESQRWSTWRGAAPAQAQQQEDEWQVLAGGGPAHHGKQGISNSNMDGSKARNSKLSTTDWSRVYLV